MQDVLEPSVEFLEADEISFSLLDICRGIKLDDKLIQVISYGLFIRQE